MSLIHLSLLFSLACRDKDDPTDSGVEGDADADADADTDTDADGDSDSDTDTDADTDIEDKDQDGDGYTPAEGDCDDADATVFPGAEDAWYDGVDSDCEGNDDYDQDGDGEASADEGGGPDCDDLDPAVNSGAEEVKDAADNDCDGMADEGFLSYGDVIVTEIMLDAVSVGDTTGEWFEVYNPGEEKVNLLGFVISSDDGDSFEVKYNLPVPAGGYRVLGVERDEGLNGGVTVNYWYNRDKFKLDNSGDGFIFELDGVTVFELEVDTSWGIEAGRSLSLDPSFSTAAYSGQSQYWCVATSQLSGGDYGTPGAENDLCTSVDHDGDGYSEDEGDCDDASADVYPDADELFDGVDNDCDGVTDDVLVEDAHVGTLDGSVYGALGSGESYGIADIDGDGDEELLVGGVLMPGYSGNVYYTGEIYALDAADFGSWAGPVGDYDEARVRGGTYGYAAAISRQGLGDVDGDGAVDLVVGGVSWGYTGYNRALAAVHPGGSGFSGNLGVGDAEVVVEGSVTQSYYQGILPSVASNGDLDGDGVAELIVGVPLGTDAGVYVLDLSGVSGTVDVVDDAEQAWSAGAGHYPGNFVAAHDLDGDGYDDWLATAHGAANSAGAVYVVYGSVGGSGGSLAAGADLSIEGSGSGDFLGQAGGFVIADVDGDGQEDLALSSVGNNEVYVFSDTTALGSGDTSFADLTLSGSGYFGSAMAAGDVDDDGVGDLLVSAPGYYAPYGWYAQSAGEVFFFSGNTLSAGGSLSSSGADGFIEGSQQQGLFGLGLFVADLDGAGGDEVVVGSPGYDNGTGRIWILDLD